MVGVAFVAGAVAGVFLNEHKVVTAEQIRAGSRKVAERIKSFGQETTIRTEV